MNKSDATFEPDTAVKREDAAFMVWKILSNRGVKVNPQKPVHLIGLVDNYAADAVTNTEALHLY